ncbi:PAS domain S-box protein [Megalodesulfovibrio paquesii]
MSAFVSMFSSISRSLAGKLVVSNGVLLLGSVALLTWAAMVNQQELGSRAAQDGAERLSTTVKLGLHYAMMLNSRDDIAQIVANIARQPEILAVRVYNKDGAIKFSNRPEEVDTVVDMTREACAPCHTHAPPRTSLSVLERTRMREDGEVRSIGMLTPIENEPGCSEGCHFHPVDTKILGAIDLVLSLQNSDEEVQALGRRMLLFSAGVFLAVSALLLFFMGQYVNRPIRALIQTTRGIARGEELPVPVTRQRDEIGQLAQAVADMGAAIAEKQKDLNRQRDEYQNLFANVPCFITVQDRNFRLLRYNREFKDHFHPRPGQPCYKAYKGRNEKCPDCPVETTFQTGRSATSEESGLDSQGNLRHWLVTTAPLRDEKGEVVAAMEMSLDITARKELEREAKRLEEKYQAIYRTIPSPVFLLDLTGLTVLDCNKSAETVYGITRKDMLGRYFPDFFLPESRDRMAAELQVCKPIERAPQLVPDGRTLYVAMLATPVEIGGSRVLLITVTDITRRLEAEQQLVHAGKMATLGEMAAGVAHELNQPLTVIKGAASYFLKKIRRGETVAPDVLADLSQEMDSHVDRATRIINHLREFGRRPEMELNEVDVGDVLGRSLEMFRQQLALRQITVELDVSPNVPKVMGDAGRLEQVFVNMLMNARDAIEEKFQGERGRAALGPLGAGDPEEKRIAIVARDCHGWVHIRVSDTGGGVPPGVQARIFEPFFTTKATGKGTGLGLSISYGIVQDCGGEIFLERTGPEGSTFLVILPSSDAAACMLPEEGTHG